MSLNILGISAYYHDSAAALVSDGRVVAAAGEERFTRKKHDPSFPSNAVRFCLEESGVPAGALDAVVFYDKPLLKFERLLETYYVCSPRGLRSFLASMPVWIKEKLFLKRLLLDEVSKACRIDRKKINLLFSAHHLSHAASAFFPSPFQEAAVLTVDGVGEWATASVAHGRGGGITTLKEMMYPHSVGLLYSAFTHYLGFKVNSGEYKLMGLAPYGNRGGARVREYRQRIERDIVDVKADGSIWLDLKYFGFHTGVKMLDDRRWEGLFGLPRRRPEAELLQEHCDLALAAQEVTEDIMLRMASTARTLAGSENLCLSGGVALNCTANGRLLRERIFRDIWIQPAAGDSGGALGAALAAYHMYYDNDRQPLASDSMRGAYLGPGFDAIDIGAAARKFRAEYSCYKDFDELATVVAGLLAAGNVVGWFQGKMEWGPRALGNRSILCDARAKDAQRRLNLKIKFREGFRPFAPAVLYEDAGEYFETRRPSPYMLLTDSVLEKRRLRPVEDHAGLPVMDRVNIARSDIPAVTHADYSARVQTVHRETNPRFWTLLKRFKLATGCPVLVNTSFNVRGEPIVCTPEDAYRCFMNTGMDYLVMEDFLFDKKRQPPGGRADALAFEPD